MEQPAILSVADHFPNSSGRAISIQSHAVNSVSSNHGIACNSASTFERLENARIESSEMQENMNKLSSFFDKYSKDKRFRIQDGWLRIKEESIQLLYKRCKLIETKLKHISTEYETLFDDLNCQSEALKSSHASTIASLTQTIETLTADHLAIISTHKEKEQEASCTITNQQAQINSLSRQQTQQIEQIQAKSEEQREKNATIQSTFETQVQSIEAQFFAQIDDMDALFAKARAQATSSASPQLLQHQINNLKQNKNFKIPNQPPWHLDIGNNNYNNNHTNALLINNNTTNQQNLSMTSPQLFFDKISPINKMNLNLNFKSGLAAAAGVQFPLRDKDLNLYSGSAVSQSSNHRAIGNPHLSVASQGVHQQRIHTGATSGPALTTQAENNNDSHITGGGGVDATESLMSSQCSHLSTSKNEGKWESRFESPSANRDAQHELKQAIIFLAEHMEMLNAVNKLNDYEKSGHIELLMHHIQANVRENGGSEGVPPRVQNLGETEGLVEAEAAAVSGVSSKINAPKSIHGQEFPIIKQNIMQQYSPSNANMSGDMNNLTSNNILPNGCCSSSSSSSSGSSNRSSRSNSSTSNRNEGVGNGNGIINHGNEVGSNSNGNNQDAFKKKRDKSQEVNEAVSQHRGINRGGIREGEQVKHQLYEQGEEFNSENSRNRQNAHRLPRTNDAHNSILELVQGDDMSFQSRLPSLGEPMDDDEEERNAAFQFQKHVLQEDLLKVRQLNETLDDDFSQFM